MTRPRQALLLLLSLGGCGGDLSADDHPQITIVGPEAIVSHPGPWRVQVEMFGAACDAPVKLQWRRVDIAAGGRATMRDHDPDVSCFDLRAYIPRMPVGARFRYWITYKEQREPSVANARIITVVDPADLVGPK